MIRPYWPRWTAWRVLRVLLLGLTAAATIETARTTPYLGLPLEPKPRFLDCYEQAAWNGRTFTRTGRTICLGAR